MYIPMNQSTSHHTELWRNQGYLNQADAIGQETRGSKNWTWAEVVWNTMLEVLEFYLDVSVLLFVDLH